jgi:adenylosuccinate synthase
MTVTVLIDTCWGDCAKAAVANYLSDSYYNLVARFAGGPNAGGSIYIKDQKFVCRHIPGGIANPGTDCILGQGMVIDICVLAEEIRTLNKIPGLYVNERLHISNKAHLILPKHLEEDKLNSKFGSTQKGVGPAFKDKVDRKGFRICDLGKVHFEDMCAFSSEELKKYNEAYELIKPMICDTSRFINEGINNGLNLLAVGSQGTLLDIDHGTYPNVTCSAATACGVAQGLGIGPTKITSTIGVSKAYCTKVGTGPFPTEILDEELSEKLVKEGNEFGSITGRKRRVGVLDIPLLKYAAEINGLDSLVVTKLDVLSCLDEIPVCIKYKDKSGKEYDFAPMEKLEEMKPIYEVLPGWKEDISKAKRTMDLPSRAIDYLSYISDMVGVKIKLVSVGPKKENVIQTNI